MRPLHSCVSPLKRGKNCSPFLGKPVFLLAAVKLIGNSHFQQSGIERWLQVCLNKVVPMAQAQCLLKFGLAQFSIANRS